MFGGDWTTFASAACNGGVAKTLKRLSRTTPSIPRSTPRRRVHRDKILASLGGLQPNQCGVITYNTPMSKIISSLRARSIIS